MKTSTLPAQFKWLIPILGLAILLIHWSLDIVKKDNLIFDVNELTQLSFLESHCTYFYMHLFAWIPVLSYSFESRIVFYKKWKHLFPAQLIVAVVFWIWDIGKTTAGVWGFNDKYYTFRILNLPIEEWFFFFTFPWASIFIYECLNYAFPLKENNIFKRWDAPLSWGAIILFFCLGIAYRGHLYTFTTFILSGFLLLWQVLYGDTRMRPLFYRAFPLMTIPFIIVDGVFTGMFTEQPIVVYNPEEYLGLRFITIPLDDFCYNFSLEFSIIMLYENFKKGKI